MAEFSLTAPHGCSPGFGAPFHLRQECFDKLRKDSNHFLHFQHSSVDSANSQSVELCLQRKEECRCSSRLLERNKLAMVNSSHGCPVLATAQGTQLKTLLFSYGIAEQCIRQETILKLLASGSVRKECSLQELCELGLQPPLMRRPLEQSGALSSWSYTSAESEWMSLAYPTKELYFNEPFLDLQRDSSIFLSDDQLICKCDGADINDLISAISELHLSKSTMKSIKQTMLVPYFEIRRKARSKTDSSNNIKAMKTEHSKSQSTVKKKATQKRTLSGRIIKQREDYSNGYLHACEHILSMIFSRNQPDRSAVISLKRSGPHVSQLLTDVSGSIAGTGIAVLLFVVHGVISRGDPFRLNGLWSAGLGLGLVWLSGAVNDLRDTMTSICRSSGDGKLKTMMDSLDRNLKDLCFRAVALLVIASLRLVLV